MIRLKGQWLVSAGFTPGEHVKVAVTGPGEIVIRRQPPNCAAEARARALAAFAALGL